MLGIRSSLDSLIDGLTRIDLQHSGRESVAPLLSESAIDTHDLREYVHFQNSRYTRNLVFRNDDFEVLVLCWAPGSASAIHDHGDRACCMAIHSGTLLVEDFAIMSGGRRQGYAHVAPSGLTHMPAGSIDIRTPSRDLHRVSAPTEPAVSIHVYAKPLDRFMIFDPSRRSCRTVFSRYDSRPGLTAP